MQGEMQKRNTFMQEQQLISTSLPQLGVLCLATLRRKVEPGVKAVFCTFETVWTHCWHFSLCF